MVYKVDYADGDVLRWSITETGVECEIDESYTLTIYVSVHDDGDFSTTRAALRDHPAVVRVAIVEERVSFRHDPEQVLRVDVVDLKAVNSVNQPTKATDMSGTHHHGTISPMGDHRRLEHVHVEPVESRWLSVSC